MTEPPSSKILWHLGMTKGAFVAVCVLVAVYIFAGLQLESLIQQNKDRIKEVTRLQTILNRQQKDLNSKQQVINRLVAQGVAAHTAACAQQTNLRQQVRSSVKYLHDVEAGLREPIRGISTADIVTSITRTQDALKAYDSLNCK